MECTICMETICEGTVLPCQCKLDYCQPCWDKALANSFSQCGQARCPSCRTMVHVDFDAATHCLRFTPETMDMTFTAQNELRQAMFQDYLQHVRSFQTGEQQDGEIPTGSPVPFQQFAETHQAFPLFTNIGHMRNNTITRLRHQAMPALKEALQRHGEANPSLQSLRNNAKEVLTSAADADVRAVMEESCISLDDCTEKIEMVERLVEQANTVELCSVWAHLQCPAPKCVCGSLFQRVSAVERFRRSPTGERASSLSDEDIQQYLQRLHSQRETIIICDICEEPVPVIHSVWTCQNRTSTILHATSYDICNGCFVRQTCGEEPASSD